MSNGRRSLFLPLQDRQVLFFLLILRRDEVERQVSRWYVPVAASYGRHSTSQSAELCND